uniref:Reverse transcriptase zinc-binding domain-containing protein n=1 Tax=Fagus sylvatica TaxID=28930 RepID=A0A2N9IE30_FAGSY
MCVLVKTKRNKGESEGELRAVVKLGASAAWRGIIARRVILEKGQRWSVGNGSQIHIWEVCWIPTPTTFKITSPKPASLDGTTNFVSDLIDPLSKSWRPELIDNLFFPHEAQVIQSIPISSRLPHDKLIWSATPSGIYLVKSGYQLLCNERISSSTRSSSNPSRNFIWRACSSSQLRLLSIDDISCLNLNAISVMAMENQPLMLYGIANPPEQFGNTTHYL